LKKVLSNPRFQPALRFLTVVLIIGLAWALHWRAVTMLPNDFDEDDYLSAAQGYAALFRSGNWAGFLNPDQFPEHPPLAKILFGLSILPAPETPLLPRPTITVRDQTLPREQVRDARTLSALFGTLEVALLALVNPLAGFILSIYALQIKYTSQLMLEALPAFTSLAMVITYTKSKDSPKSLPHKTGWLALSAVFLGLTAASKYMYCVAGVAILLDWYLLSAQADQERLGNSLAWIGWFRRYAPPKNMLLWGLLAMLVFFACDPYLWPAPLARLEASIFYHTHYAIGTDVHKANFPFYHPLIWLFLFPVSMWHPDVFPFVLDPLIAQLACFGLVGLWKRERVYVLWLGLGLLFLLVWPTKWLQYVLILTAPLTLATSEALTSLGKKLLAWWRAGHRLRRLTRHETP
jgi:hypothetical protein